MFQPFPDLSTDGPYQKKGCLAPGSPEELCDATGSDVNAIVEKPTESKTSEDDFSDR